MVNDSFKRLIDVPVVTVVEGAVGNAQESLRLGVVGVLAIALEQRKGRDEVTLLQEVVRIWQSQFFLLWKHGKQGDKDWLIICCESEPKAGRESVRRDASSNLSVYLRPFVGPWEPLPYCA